MRSGRTGEKPACYFRAVGHNDATVKSWVPAKHAGLGPTSRDSSRSVVWSPAACRLNQMHTSGGSEE